MSKTISLPSPDTYVMLDDLFFEKARNLKPGDRIVVCDGKPVTLEDFLAPSYHQSNGEEFINLKRSPR